LPEEPNRPKRLTDLETVVLREFRLHHHQAFPSARMDDAYLSSLARVAVEALTTGSASGRRRGVKEPRRYPDPGCTPDSIRRLARYIEGSFHSMPNGWVSAYEPKEETSG
jgi:hypothetical protein